MEYSKLVAVTGLPGLYELINSKGDGAIVRSLNDKSTRFISSRIHNFSQLESIEVYTTGENVNLAEVLLSMQNSNEKLPDEKDAAAVRKYFDIVYPDLDFDRVYNSDLKKMLKWFEVIQQHKIEIKLPEEPAEQEDQEEIVETQSEEETKSKKSAAKKEEDPGEKPGKKTASKKN